MTRYRVTVNGWTLTLNAESAYFAAMVYNATTSDPGEDAEKGPRLEESTILEVRALGRKAVSRVLWRDVMDWSNRESQAAFGRYDSSFANGKISETAPLRAYRASSQ